MKDNNENLKKEQELVKKIALQYDEKQIAILTMLKLNRVAKALETLIKYYK